MGDWLFLSAAVGIGGVAIRSACPLSIVNFVPRVSRNNMRDYRGAGLKVGEKCLGFGVQRNDDHECGVQGWISRGLKPLHARVLEQSK